MQLDMHFYAVYAIARAAGIKAPTARTIAYASQFVDDAIDDDEVVLQTRYAVVPTMTSHKPIDYRNALQGDQWKVWIPFHFLPGAESASGDFIEMMVCRKNSRLAQKMMNEMVTRSAGDSGPHLLGIAAHAYADTFSHYGFAGISHGINKVDAGSIKLNTRQSPSLAGYIKNKFMLFTNRIAGTVAETIPVGHGSVATYPDRPYLDWQFTYELSGKKEVRSNPATFLECTRRLHAIFTSFAEVSRERCPEGRSWNEIEKAVTKNINEKKPVEQRVELWRKSIASGALCKVTDSDKTIDYKKELWLPAQLRYHGNNQQEVKKTDTLRFYRAAVVYRNYVLEELLPAYNLRVV
ncbi:MAG: hypothetical protein JXA71_16415 [Chitinispirillaceae bacterium]|nr:hypothetical protein [Chitinispirillaceae bacterium]